MHDCVGDNLISHIIVKIKNNSIFLTRRVVKIYVKKVKLKIFEEAGSICGMYLYKHHNNVSHLLSGKRRGTKLLLRFYLCTQVG
jgi:hypothetical protein